MPNFTPTPGAPYSSEDPYPHQAANAVSESIVKAHNADEGSAHAPTGVSAWSGAIGFGWTFADGFPFSGDLDVTGGITLDTATTGPIIFGTLVQLRVYGGLTIKTPLGGITLETGTICTMNAGSTTNLNGATVVRGVMTIEKTGGGPGSVEVEDTCTLNLQIGSLFTVRTNAATVEALGKIQWKSTAVLQGLAGASGQWAGTWEWTGDVTFDAASSLTIEAGADVDIAADVEVTGDVLLTGDTTFGDGTFPLLDPARTWTRRAGRIAAVNYDPDAVALVTFSAYFANTPILRLLSGASVSNKVMFEFDPPPDGATAIEVVIQSRGPNPLGDVTTNATYHVVRWQEGTLAVPGSMSPITDDAHDLTQAQWQTKQTTTIAVNANATIDRAYRYGVLVTLPDIAGTTVTLDVDIKMTGTVDGITGR